MAAKRAAGRPKDREKGPATPKRRSSERPPASSTSVPGRAVALERRGTLRVGTFRAMASPCEVLVDGGGAREARGLVELAAREAWRIERTFSRYRDDNVVHRINTSGGRPLDVDAETARLLDFAERCHALSDGLFDVTSGVLRRAWSSGASLRVPDEDEVRPLLALVGWQRVSWQRPRLTLPAGMQIDFGGIGKEYAVDRVLALLAARSEHPVLVNFGGDLHASGPPASGAWQVGIESVRATDADPSRTAASGTVALRRGAMATSGDAWRHATKDGVRHGHVLSPLTGWPVPDAPRSVTVMAESCTQAGLLATLGLLKGADAESFLEAEGVTFWCQRDGPSRDR